MLKELFSHAARSAQSAAAVYFQPVTGFIKLIKGMKHD